MWLIIATTVYRNSTATVHSSQSGVLHGTADGQFNGPDGVAVDSSGNVYVADTSNHVYKNLTAMVPSLQSGVLLVQLMDNSVVH